MKWFKWFAAFALLALALNVAPMVTSAQPPPPPIQPLWCCSTAVEILNVGSWYNPEYVARWDYANAYNAHYTGTGGDQATCDYPVDHKCIGTWTWTTVSRTHDALLLPKLGWMIGGPAGAGTASNYYSSIQ